MSAQLEQLVGYLDRDGVTEVVISVGRPIAMRQRDAFVNLTARPLTSDQLMSLLRGTPIAAMVPEDDGTGDASEVAIGKRRARVQVGRRGEEIVVRLERPQAKTASVAPSRGTEPPSRIVETTRAPSQPPPGDTSTKSPTAVPRTKTSSKSPGTRTKAPTAEPVSASMKAPTASPRAKSATGSRLAPAPRAKTPSSAGIAIPTTPSGSGGSGPIAKPPPPPVEAMSLDIDLGTLSGARTASKRAATDLGTPVGASATQPAWGLDVDLGQTSTPSAAGFPGDAPLALGDLELDPDSPALELDPADSRATFGKRSDAMDARPTWDAGASFSNRATPLPVAAQAARTAATAAASSPAPAAPVSAVPLLPSLAAPSPVATAALSARPALTTPVLADGPLAQLVKRARERGASDLHVASGRPVSIRLGGELIALDAAPLSVAAAEAMLLPLLDGTLRAQLERLGYADLAVPLASGGRLRTNITRHSAGLKGTFRLAMPAPVTLDELGLPKELAKVVGHHQGLVVIAGPSGHGKTTTLAALVDLVNATKPYHILTVEDPIEIVYARKAAVVSQREAGRHTKTFAAALKASLREDPDVIVIGELRDRETVEIALTASETGHLVLATMSTPSASKTLDRLIDMFPPDEHPQVRASIAGALRAIVAQRLLPARDGKVAAAIELVTGVLPLAVLIRDDKLYQLPNLMQRGKAFGMIRFDDSLAELVRTGKITEDVAMSVAASKAELSAALKRPG